MAKAWDVTGLGPDIPLGVCARRIIDTRFREMMSYRVGTIAGTDIEQLHSMRVSSRRLRSAMRNFRDCFDRDRFREHVDVIRDIADSLGNVRDLDVRIAGFQDYLTRAPLPERSGVCYVIERANREREVARAPMIALLEKLEREAYEARFLAFIWEDEVAAHG